MKEIVEKLKNNYNEINKKKEEVYLLNEECDELLYELSSTIMENIPKYQTTYKELRGLTAVARNQYGIDFLFKSNMLPYAEGLKIIEDLTGLKFVGTGKHDSTCAFHAI